MPSIKNTILVTSLCVTSLLSGFFIHKYYNLVQENEKKNEVFKIEKQILQTQLEEILINYDKVKSENIDLKKNNDQIFEVYNTLQNSSDEYNFVNDNSPSGKVHNLKVQNERLRNQISDFEANIERNKIKIHQIEEHNFTLNKKNVSQLKAINVNARGVRILSDLYKKDKVQPIQELRICYTLEGSEFIGEGNKKVYIQIINPNNQIISLDKDYFEDSLGNRIVYSSKMDVAYNQKDTDVCTYVDLEKNKTIKGNYQINLFYNSMKIGTTTYQYN